MVDKGYFENVKRSDWGREVSCRSVEVMISELGVG
jgi:hypothetical protein